MYIIYALIDPRAVSHQNCFYVGMTENVFKRFVAHIRCSGNNYEKNARITEMRSECVLPLFIELERCEDIGLARVREIYWINHYRMLQHPLTNIQQSNLRFVKSVLIRNPKTRGKKLSSIRRETTREETPEIGNEAFGPVVSPAIKRATFADAVEVWNVLNANIGRPRLREELRARGLECSDDLAKQLLKTIKQRLGSAGGGGGE